MIQTIINNHWLISTLIAPVTAIIGFFAGRKMKAQGLFSAELQNLNKVRDEEKELLQDMSAIVEQYKEIVQENLILINNLKKKIKSQEKYINELLNTKNNEK